MKHNVHDEVSLQRLFGQISIWIALFVALTACGSGTPNIIADDPTVTPGEGLYSTGEGPIHSRYGWEKAVTIFVDESVPNDVATATQNAIDSWNEAAGRTLLEFGGRKSAAKQISQFSTLDDDDTIVYYDESWTEHMNKSITTLATTVWENDAAEVERIIRADIVLNGERYMFQDALGPAKDPSKTSVLADVETTIAHEIGHLLGLGHVSIASDPHSLMHAQTRIGANYVRRYPSDLDGDLVRDIYVD